MKRPVWKGTISFGLVSIPIELHKAVEAHAISFKMLHDKCKTPLENKRWCPHCHREVAWDHVLKGLKQEDGSYIALSQEELEELKPEKTDTLTLAEFVDAHKVSPIYYDRHYYVLPQSKSDKPYFLLKAALAKYKQVAVGQFVMRDKDAVCVIEPYGDGLLLSTLNYSYEILPMEQVTQEPKITSKELELAQMLMKKLYNKTFDIAQFNDTFAARLQRAIKAKKQGKPVKPKKVIKVPKGSLMDTLRASVEEARKR